MGCDIHLAVERQNKDGSWEDISSEAINGYCGSWRDENYEYEKSPSQRNYTLFALLADVRNDCEFADFKTGKSVSPKFPGRGLPDDCNFDSDGHMRNGPKDANGDPDYESDDYRSLGDHSFTHATLRELLCVPWDVVVTDNGILDESVYLRWEAKGREGPPESWSGGVWGGGIQTVTEDEYKSLRSRDNDPGMTSAEELQNWLNRAANAGVRYCIKATWKWQPLVDRAFHKWVTWMGAKYPHHNRVRVLIGFDS